MIRTFLHHLTSLVDHLVEKMLRVHVRKGSKRMCENYYCWKQMISHSESKRSFLVRNRLLNKKILKENTRSITPAPPKFSKRLLTNTYKEALYLGTSQTSSPNFSTSPKIQLLMPTTANGIET